MTRKLIVVFIVLTLCLYCLILSFFGERGIIVNNQLKRQLKENEYELDRRNVEIENLKLQEQELSTDDGLRSAAMNLGYQVDGDDVYIFPTEEAEVTAAKTEAVAPQQTKVQTFEPWPIGKCLLISFCSSFIITFILWLFGRGKDKEDDSQQEESGNAGDNLNLD